MIYFYLLLNNFMLDFNIDKTLMEAWVSQTKKQVC